MLILCRKGSPVRLKSSRRVEEGKGLESACPHLLTSHLSGTSGHNGVKSTPDHLLYKEPFPKIKDFITLPVSWLGGVKLSTFILRIPYRQNWFGIKSIFIRPQVDSARQNVFLLRSCLTGGGLFQIYRTFWFYCMQKYFCRNPSEWQIQGITFVYSIQWACCPFFIEGSKLKTIHFFQTAYFKSEKNYTN